MTVGRTRHESRFASVFNLDRSGERYERGRNAARIRVAAACQLLSKTRCGGVCPAELQPTRIALQYTSQQAGAGIHAIRLSKALSIHLRAGSYLTA